MPDLLDSVFGLNRKLACMPLADKEPNSDVSAAFPAVVGMRSLTEARVMDAQDALRQKVLCR